MAGTHERPGVHLPGRSTPPWRAAKLPVRVRIAWLRAELPADCGVSLRMRYAHGGLFGGHGVQSRAFHRAVIASSPAR